MRRLALLITAVALVGCGGEDQQSEVDARAAAERTAVLQIIQLQGALAKAETTYADGEQEEAATQLLEAYTLYFPRIEDPLADMDSDLARSLVDDMNHVLPQRIATGAPDAEVKRLFEQLQTDLLTAADAIKS